jgi:hypothetical protein
MQLAVDSTSLGAMKTCAKFYELSIIRGWTSKKKNIHLEFGLALHGGRERYYHLRAEGSDHNYAVCCALKYVLHYSWDFELDRPKAVFSEDTYKNRFTLARTMVWYLDHWENDPLETIILANGKPAVELSFQVPLGLKTQTTGEDYTLCGHLDRAVGFQEANWGSDLKSTKNSLDSYYFANFTPDNQMSTYSFAGKIIFSEPLKGIILDAAQVGVGFSRFARGLVHRTSAQLDEWHRGVKVLLAQFEQYARAQFWPMNEKACYNCQYRSICSHSPQVREKWLAADFVKRLWNPLVARGDI